MKLRSIPKIYFVQLTLPVFYFFVKRFQQPFFFFLTPLMVPRPLGLQFLIDGPLCFFFKLFVFSSFSSIKKKKKKRKRKKKTNNLSDFSRECMGDGTLGTLKAFFNNACSQPERLLNEK